MFDERMGTSPKNVGMGTDVQVHRLAIDGYGQWVSVRVGDWRLGPYPTQIDWSSNGEDSPGVVGCNKWSTQSGSCAESRDEPWHYPLMVLSQNH